MAAFPFLHPALIGVGVVGALAWAAAAPARWRAPWLCALVGAAAAATSGLCRWTPWIGELRLTAYGVMLLAAFASGWWLILRRSRRLDGAIEPWFVREQIAIAAIAGILGARLWFVIEYRAEFPDPRADFSAWLSRAADLDRGGAVWFGGLALAVVAMVVHAWRSRVRLLPWADCAAPAVLAGLALGRIGCFANGCCYGRHTDLPWGVLHGSDHVHPTQLYESAACAAMAVAVYRIAPGNGAATGWALIGYAAWRFTNETLRGDYGANHVSSFSLSPFSLTSAQWLCLPLLAAGAWLALRARRAAAVA